MSTGQTILITGSTGNIGRKLVPMLRSAGANVIAANHTRANTSDVQSRAIDFNDREALELAFQGVDTLFLLFPLVPKKRDLARNALAAARAAGVKHIVRSSGAGADAQSPWSLSALQGEIDDMVLNSGVPATLMRPSSFMQNWITYYAGMIKSGTVYLPLADGKTVDIDIADIAKACVSVLLNPDGHAGKTYTLTGPQAMSVNDALAEIGRVTGQRANYVPISEVAAIQSMKSAGMSDWTIDVLSSLNRSIAAGETASTTKDVELLTGQPPRRFAEFLRDHADAWR